jgi:hypothetical protein
MSQFSYPNPRAIPQRGAVHTNAPPAVKTIPFDYVFQFSLLGQRGNKVQDVVEISTEGVFVALSVGYSLVLDERRTPRTFGPVINQNTLLRSPSFVPFLSDPQTAINKLFITGAPGAEIAVVLLKTPSGNGVINLVNELPRILISGTLGSDGTLLLDLNLPGQPSQVIPLESQFLLWDRSNNLFGQLFELGALNTETAMTPVIGPDPTTKQLPAAGASQVHIFGRLDNPIDLTVLKGDGSDPIRRNNIKLNQPFTFFDDASVSGAKVTLDSPLSPGDLLIVGLANTSVAPLGVDFSVFNVPRVKLSDISLGALVAGLGSSGADLTRGFRLNPAADSLLAANLAIDQVDAGTLGRIFETGAVAAEEVSFLYSLDVSGTGREYQSKPIHNIAGLGIANGDRPFRPFAKPVMFEPKSSVRIQVEELSGPAGTLSIVLQGYKMLGTGRIPG